MTLFSQFYVFSSRFYLFHSPESYRLFLCRCLFHFLLPKIASFYHKSMYTVSRVYVGLFQCICECVMFLFFYDCTQHYHTICTQTYSLLYREKTINKRHAKRIGNGYCYFLFLFTFSKKKLHGNE